MAHTTLVIARTNWTCEGTARLVASSTGVVARTGCEEVRDGASRFACVWVDVAAVRRIATTSCVLTSVGVTRVRSAGLAVVGSALVPGGFEVA